MRSEGATWREGENVNDLVRGSSKGRQIQLLYWFSLIFTYISRCQEECVSDVEQKWKEELEMTKGLKTKLL